MPESGISEQAIRLKVEMQARVKRMISLMVFWLLVSIIFGFSGIIIEAFMVEK